VKQKLRLKLSAPISPFPFTPRWADARRPVALYMMLAPYLAGAALLVALPAVFSFALSFTQYDALSAPTWRGLWNFREIFRDPLFSIAARNSLVFVALAVPLRLLGALALALLLRQRRRGVAI
jgi:multiple sugar transport system permease protein